MKIKKKSSKDNVSYFIDADPRNINFAKILRSFNLIDVFVELLDLKEKPSEFEEFLQSNSIEHVLKSDIELYINARLKEEKFDDFFSAIKELDFEEMRIWNYSTICTDSSQNSTAPIFYIDYCTTSKRSVEIICDRTFDKEDAEESLCNILSHKHDFQPVPNK